MSAVDFLDEWFECEELKAPMSVSGIIGTFLGVRSPGTAYVLLHHYMGEIDGAFRSWGFQRGGTGGVSRAIANAARHFGAEIRTEASVERVLVEGGRAVGVALENGDELRARTVVSGCDPRRTFVELVGPDQLPAEFLTGISRYRFRGSSGKVNLALDRLPEFACRPGEQHLRGDIAIAPSIDYLERAYDEAKYGSFSSRPYINVVIPSTVDPSVAPAGKHVMSCFVQYAPYEIAEGPEVWPAKREAFGDAVVETLAEYIPGFRDIILHRQVLTPWDLEQEFGLAEGNIFHGELTPRSVGVPASDRRLGALQDAACRAVAGGIGRPSRRRAHGGPRGALRPRDARGEGGLMGASRDRAIVLGADIEGLAAAAVLARAGRAVVLVDVAEAPGGLARRYQFHPGFSAPGLLNELALVRQRALDALDLSRAGLAWGDGDAPLHVIGNEPRVIGRRAVEGGGDGAAYVRWRERVEKLRRLADAMLAEPPPAAHEPGARDLLRLLRRGAELRRLGAGEMLELLRVAPLPAWDWLAEDFEDPAVRAGLVAPALAGTHFGPRAAGSAALVLLREAVRGPELAGGLAALVDALGARCRELGVEFALGRGPAGIRAGHGGVEGVTFEGGDYLEASLVLSALGPRATLVDLLPPGLLSHAVEGEAQHWRVRGSSAVVLVALESDACLPAGVERCVDAAHPVVLERAADALKYGEPPLEPWLDVRVWRAQSGCAPQGAATLAVHVHGVPRHARFDWDSNAGSDAREALTRRVLERLGVLFPGLAAVASELLAPIDLEARFGAPGGHLYGGELALDQLWLQRPSLALGRYATPVPGLYLCGASSHPGGPFHGGAGLLGARAALTGGRR